MPAPKCPFQHPIISRDFACRLGRQVTARNTPQVHCRSEPALRLCNRVYEHLKAIGLPGFGMQDDLTSTPHNVYLKIQYGGLLGLQALTGEPPAAEGKIADIRTLVETVTGDGGRVDELSYADLLPSIQQYQVKRRRGRKG